MASGRRFEEADNHPRAGNVGKTAAHCTTCERKRERYDND
jgi:hypothetical protein